jgi:hypothetical protein
MHKVVKTTKDVFTMKIKLESQRLREGKKRGGVQGK